VGFGDSGSAIGKPLVPTHPSETTKDKRRRIVREPAGSTMWQTCCRAALVKIFQSKAARDGAECAGAEASPRT
jgi:hypothetical protein